MGDIDVKMVRFYLCILNAMQMADYYCPNCYEPLASHKDESKHRRWTRVYGKISNAFEKKYGKVKEILVQHYLGGRYKTIYDVKPILKEIQEGTFKLEYNEDDKGNQEDKARKTGLGR